MKAFATDKLPGRANGRGRPQRSSRGVCRTSSSRRMGSITCGKTDVRNCAPSCLRSSGAQCANKSGRSAGHDRGKDPNRFHCALPWSALFSSIRTTTQRIPNESPTIPSSNQVRIAADDLPGRLQPHEVPMRAFLIACVVAITIAAASAILLEAVIQVGAKLAASPGRVPGFLREGAGMLRGGKCGLVGRLQTTPDRQGIYPDPSVGVSRTWVSGEL